MIDEAAERDLCTREWSRVDKDKTVGVVTWLMELRAQARAEGYAQAKREVEFWQNFGERR